MADDNVRVYFYNGEWREFDYLHDHYGITLTPSTPTQVYDNSLHPHDGWIENDSGNHDYWVVYPEPTEDDRTGEWYTLNDLPYWIKLSTKFNVYLIGQLLQLDAYKRQTSELYNYNGALTSYDVMHNSFGITLTPSTVYFVKNNIIKCWYNPDHPTDRYWDVDTAHWYYDAPEYDHDVSGDINSVGATGLFLYYSVTGQPTSYGTLVDGHRLQPISLNMPLSGDLSCQRHSIELTGTWKILTETAETSPTKPCIVFATKIYDAPPNEDSSSTNSTSSSAAPNSSSSVDMFDL